jgi:hypothetical protein
VTLSQWLSAGAEKKMVAAIQSREEQNGCRRSWDPKFLQSRNAWRPSPNLNQHVSPQRKLCSTRLELNPLVLFVFVQRQPQFKVNE